MTLRVPILTLVFVIHLALVGSVAAAEPQPHFMLKVEKGANDNWACTPELGVTKREAFLLGSIEVSGGDLKEATVDGKKIEVEDGKITFTEWSKADSPAVTVKVKDGENEKEVPCISIKLPAKAASVDSPDLDVAGAQEWWQMEGKEGGAEELKKVRKGLPDLPWFTKFLVHLPNGQLVGGSSASFREGAAVQRVVILPHGSNGVPSVGKLENCAATESFRPKEQTKKAAELEKPKEGEQSTGFRLQAVGPYFRCGAGDATYKLTIQYEKHTVEKETSVHLRRLWHAAPSLLLGYNTASRTNYEIVEGSGTRKIGQYTEGAGPMVATGLIWNPFGADAEVPDLETALTNVFVGVDPSKPLEHFVLGLGLTYTGGVTLVGAVSFRPGIALAGGQAKDSEIPAPGGISTRNDWSKPSIGFMLGLAIDTNLGDAFGGLFKAAEEKKAEAKPAEKSLGEETLPAKTPAEAKPTGEKPVGERKA